MLLDPLLLDPHLDLFKSPRYTRFMNKETIRTSLDLPRDLHRRLHERAARERCSARHLMLKGIERSLDEPRPQRPRCRLLLEVPIVSTRGKPFELSNDEIYDVIEFP